MSRSEFFDRLMQIGMGWLGWTEQATLDTSIPAIFLAYEGRERMLKLCFGSGEDEPDKAPEPEEKGPPRMLQIQNALRSLAG